MKFLGKRSESLRNLAVSVTEAFFAFIAKALVSEYSAIPELNEYKVVSEYIDCFDFNANFAVSDFTEWAEFAEYPAKTEYADEIEESDVLACLAWFAVSETNDVSEYTALIELRENVAVSERVALFARLALSAKLAVLASAASKEYFERREYGTD